MDANGHYAGKKDGLTEYETLIDLARVINSALPDPLATEIRTIQGNASEFKKCVNSGGGYFPFGDDASMEAFDNKIKRNYQKALNAMCDFVDVYIDTNKELEKDKTLVKALIDLISSDTTISPDQIMFINEDGSPSKKSEIINMKTICLQPFLLGVFHYAVVVQRDNNVGAGTFNLWCPSTGGGKRLYKGNMGKGIQDVKLVYASKSVYVEAEIVEDDMDPEGSANQQERAESEIKSAPQMNFTFNVTGNNNSFYNHVDTVNNFYGGKKDGE